MPRDRSSEFAQSRTKHCIESLAKSIFGATSTLLAVIGLLALGFAAMKTLIIFILLCVFCAIGIGASQPQPNNWEYKFEYKVNEKKANELAAQGWELTAVGNEASGPMASTPFMVFRRSK